MIWLRWAAEAVEGLQKASAVKEETGQTPSDGKVSLTGMKFQVFGSQVSEKVLPSTGSDRSFI